MLLRTFGSLVLEGSDFTRPKPLLLLSYLALEGPQDRRCLAELFWPGASDHLKSLTVALVRLRKGAPGVIEADHERVWATVETDAERFLTLLEHSCFTKLMNVLEWEKLWYGYLTISRFEHSSSLP
jgi:DNA-binding SARP family transcriptional activator